MLKKIHKTSTLVVKIEALMKFHLKGSQILARHLKGWLKTKTLLQDNARQL